MNTNTKLHYIQQYHNYNDKAYDLAINEFNLDEIPEGNEEFNDRVKEIFNELVTNDIEYYLSVEDYDKVDEMKEFYNL